MKYVKPIDPVTTWHLLQANLENAAHYASSLIKYTKPEDLKEKYWFPTPEDPWDPQHHTPIRKTILSELINLQELEKLNPQDDTESRRQFLSNFDWTDSKLQPAEIARIEDLLVKFHDIFARHRFDIDMNEDFKVKLTPKDDSPAYSHIVRVCQPQSISRRISLWSRHYFTVMGSLQPSHSLNMQANFCPKETQWKTTTFSRFRENQQPQFRRLHKQQSPGEYSHRCSQHTAGKKLFCKLDCSQAYHCLQMADQRSIEMRAFNFASRTFAYRRLAQGLSRALSAFSSFMREYLDKVIKADKCAQYVDDIGIAANDAEQLINNLRATFQGIQRAGLKLTMHKCHFRATEIDFLGRTITPYGVKPQRPRVQNFLENTKFPKSKKALQRYLGFLNYYRNYIPRLSEKLTPFSNYLLKMKKSW